MKKKIWPISGNLDLVNNVSVALVVIPGTYLSKVQIITGPRNMFHVCCVFIQDRGCNSFENDIEKTTIEI